MLNIPSYSISTPELSESSQFSFVKDHMFTLAKSKFFDDLMNQDIFTYVTQVSKRFKRESEHNSEKLIIFSNYRNMTQNTMLLWKN